MGFGDSITVIKPERLREEIREECRKMEGEYGEGRKLTDKISS